MIKTLHIPRTADMQVLSFESFVARGLRNAESVHNGLPYAWKFLGMPVTHETDDQYLICHPSGHFKFSRRDILVVHSDTRNLAIIRDVAVAASIVGAVDVVYLSEADNNAPVPGSLYHEKSLEDALARHTLVGLLITDKNSQQVVFHREWRNLRCKCPGGVAPGYVVAFLDAGENFIGDIARQRVAGGIAEVLQVVGPKSAMISCGGCHTEMIKTVGTVVDPSEFPQVEVQIPPDRECSNCGSPLGLLSGQQSLCPSCTEMYNARPA